MQEEELERFGEEFTRYMNQHLCEDCKYKIIAFVLSYNETQLNTLPASAQ